MAPAASSCFTAAMTRSSMAPSQASNKAPIIPMRMPCMDFFVWVQRLMNALGLDRVTGSSTANPQQASAALRASKPAVSTLGERGTIPSFSHLPALVLRPKVPQNAAGTRTEPEVSEPKASWQAPIHNDTGAPELEPPGTRCSCVSNGLTGTGQ